jgi:hypothetical protein
MLLIKSIGDQTFCFAFDKSARYSWAAHPRFVHAAPLFELGSVSGRGIHTNGHLCKLLTLPRRLADSLVGT